MAWWTDLDGDCASYHRRAISESSKSKTSVMEGRLRCSPVLRDA